MNKKVSPVRCNRTGEAKTMTAKSLQPWQHYDTILRGKIQARKLSAIYYKAGAEVAPDYTRRGQRVAMCHDTIGVQNGKIVTCWHCSDRLCPICTAKLSRRIAANARAVIERAQLEADLRPYLLTLTQRNCSNKELPLRIDEMLKSWYSIIHDLRTHKKYLAGYARTIEITIGRDGLYHPHIHALILLSSDAPKEMSRARYWANLWSKYMNTKRYQGNTMPICDIRPIRPNRRKHISSEAAAAAEVSKYVTKSGTILSHVGAYEHILAIDNAISGRRLRTYGGIWRRIRADMKLEDSMNTMEPPNEYLANAPLELWQFVGMDKQYHRVI